MKCWPVPNSYSKKIPMYGSPGSFWENRGDRYHCGIDIYAPKNSEVISIDDGVVIKTGVFTTPKKVTYWNETKYVLFRNNDDLYYKYAELENIIYKENEFVKAGQLIGHVGLVLNIEKINNSSPAYIQKIKNNLKPSMLHFEVYESKPSNNEYYLGGNWFGVVKPKNLLDPTDFLKYKIKTNHQDSKNIL